MKASSSALLALVAEASGYSLSGVAPTNGLRAQISMDIQLTPEQVAAYGPPAIRKSSGSSAASEKAVTEGGWAVPSNLPSEAAPLAEALCPAIGFYDPLGLATADFWGKGNDFTWGFLRQAEIKHGRVAMAAFVGYLVQANGVHFPFPAPDASMYAAGLSPPEQWDATPLVARYQIILFIGFLEWWSEFAPDSHYTKGGKPGYFPPFDKGFGWPHPFPVPPLYLSPSASKMTAEQKERGLLVELNNGRLAMIGIMGFLAAGKVPGSVPVLTDVVKPYAGDVMAPFM